MAQIDEGSPLQQRCLNLIVALPVGLLALLLIGLARGESQPSKAFGFFEPTLNPGWHRDPSQTGFYGYVLHNEQTAANTPASLGLDRASVVFIVDSAPTTATHRAALTLYQDLSKPPDDERSQRTCGCISVPRQPGRLGVQNPLSGRAGCSRTSFFFMGGQSRMTFDSVHNTGNRSRAYPRSAALVSMTSPGTMTKCGITRVICTTPSELPQTRVKCGF
jgi:hypothetical protein